MMPGPERLREFFAERSGWLEVGTAPSINRPGGGGWDIVVRLDGTYFSDQSVFDGEAGPAELVQGFVVDLNDAFQDAGLGRPFKPADPFK